MSRYQNAILQRRAYLAQEIRGLEFSLQQFARFVPLAVAAGTLAAKLQEVRAEKEAIDADLQRLLGLH